MKNLKNIIFAFVMDIASFQISYAESVDSQLINIAGSCNVERVKKLVKFGADINAKNNKGESAFMKALSDGKLEMAEFLENNGANTK